MKYFFSLKARFTLFLALLTACALLVLAALNHMHDTTERLKAVESARYQATQLATTYKALITAMTRDTMAFVSSEQPEFEQSFLQHLAILQGTRADAQGTQADMLSRFRQAGFTPEELTLLEHAHAEVMDLIAIQEEAIGTAKGEVADGAGGIKIALPNTLLAKALVYGQQYTDAAAAIAASIDQFDAMQSTRMAQRVDAASAQGQVARHIALATLIALMLSSALALRSLYQSIKRPLDQGIDLASRLAQGDLTAHIAQPRRDEPGRLIEALNGIRSSLHQTIQGITTRADHIGAVAHAITQSHEDLQQRSETQTTMLQNTAATMTALAHTVRLNDERTTEARSLSRASDTCARQSEQAVQALADTMDHITHDADKISTATRLIRDIAFQTNILALNAAVEAAHAGPQGRGFSVVASEVRNLAQRCDLAARTITQLIDQALEHSRQGAALALSARSAMKQVVHAANENERLMGEIADASETQAASIRDTAQATHDIESITRHNTQRTRQAAQAIFGQRTEIEGLQHAMAQFKLELFVGQALRIGL